MVVKAVIEWQGPAGIGETLHIVAGITRWGTTSFDVGFTGAVEDRPVFTATVTYVGVDTAPKPRTPPPPSVCSALDG